MARQVAVLDLWEQVGPLFEGSPEVLAEITIMNLDSSGMSQFIVDFLQATRGCDTSFKLANTDYRVLVPSPARLQGLVESGGLSGVIWASPPAMPTLALYIDRNDYIGISYARGEWSALSLLALYNLVEDILSYSPNADIFWDDLHYSDEEIQRLEAVWNQFRST